MKLLLDRFGIAPTSDENEISEQTIEATSVFESRSLTRVRWKDIDLEGGTQPDRLSREAEAG